MQFEKKMVWLNEKVMDPIKVIDILNIGLSNTWIKDSIK